MKHIAPQFPLPLDREPFALETERTQDGERLAAERERQADRDARRPQPVQTEIFTLFAA